MGREQDMALYTLKVPRRVPWLGPTRARVRRLLRACAVSPHVLDGVVWVLDAALSSAIDHLARHPRDDNGGLAEVCLHIDEEVVVLTAVDHFTWSLDSISGEGAQADQWRHLAGYADVDVFAALAEAHEQLAVGLLVANLGDGG